jgi:hypothetical protein
MILVAESPRSDRHISQNMVHLRAGNHAVRQVEQQPELRTL